MNFNHLSRKRDDTIRGSPSFSMTQKSPNNESCGNGASREFPNSSLLPGNCQNNSELIQDAIHIRIPQSQRKGNPFEIDKSPIRSATFDPSWFQESHEPLNTYMKRTSRVSISLENLTKEDLALEPIEPTKQSRPKRQDIFRHENLGPAESTRAQKTIADPVDRSSKSNNAIFADDRNAELFTYSSLSTVATQKTHGEQVSPLRYSEQNTVMPNENIRYA